MRPLRSYAVFAGWFALVGPFVVLPAPILLAGAHLVGFVPAVLTGVALAHRYRRIFVPTRAWRRALSGFQVGFTVTFLCAVLAAIAFRLGGASALVVPVRLWLEDSTVLVVGASFLGSIAGAFAFAVMPVRLRGPSAPLTGDSQEELLSKDGPANGSGQAGASAR